MIQACMTRLQLERQERVKRSTMEGAQLVKLLLEEEHATVDTALIREQCNFNSDHVLFLPFVLAGVPLRDRNTRSNSTMWIRDHADPFIHTMVESICSPDTPRSIFTYSSKGKRYGLITLESQTTNDIITLVPEVQNQLDHLLKRLTLEHHLALYLVIGKPTSDPTQLHPLLHETDKMLYQRFYQKDCNVFHASTKEASSSTKPALLQLDENDKKRIVFCLENANERDTLELIRRLSQDILNTTHISTSPDIWLAYLQEIISIIIRFANKNHIHIEGVYSERLLNLTFVEDFQTFEAMFDWLGRWMVHLGIVYTEGLTHNHQQDVIIFEHIESFIRENIDQDISLQMVADRFFYNPSYLSRLFKRKLNKNYMRFVTEIRIEYAKECLKKPEYLVTDVCTMCGYKSYKHFVKTFRSVTNMTPSDYRKQSGW